MENYDWQVVARSMKVVWRSATVKHGEPFVTMVSTLLMQLSSVDNWDTLALVNITFGER